MDLSLVELREELDASLAAFTAASDAIKEAADDADLTALEATFKEAEERYTTARAEHRKASERQERARKRFELTERANDALKLVDEPGTPDVKVGKEPLTYNRHGEHGFFRDLFRRDLAHDQAASERLARHTREMEVEQRAKFDLSSTDSAGGYLVAPLYLQDQFVDLARAGRVVTDAIGTRPLPPNTDTINLPTLSTGVSVADQSDGGGLSETDAVFSTIAGAVKTQAGMQDVSQQLVDRSVPGVDEVIFSDLVKVYSLNIDTAVINSATANNLGLLQVSGINAVTYTDSTPTLGELYAKIADAIQQIHSNVFRPANAIFMHPRRWGWCLAALDSSNRPLITPNAPQNAAGGFGGVVAEGLVGSIQGLPVYVDANIPATLGSGTNEDAIIVCNTDELFVYEDQSGPYLETFRDVGSGTLTVRFRLHNYWAQINARRPKAISKITGTGLAAPTF
jgi:HK97 family phage major capsid protein